MVAAFGSHMPPFQGLKDGRSGDRFIMDHFLSEKDEFGGITVHGLVDVVFRLPWSIKPARMDLRLTSQSSLL